MFVNPISQRPKQVRFGPIGICIYCRSSLVTAHLTREHVIPDAIWGALVLDDASCVDCANKIKKFEPDAVLGSFGQVRMAYGIHSRKRRGKKAKPRPNTYVTFARNPENFADPCEQKITPWSPFFVTTYSYSNRGPIILSGEKYDYDGSLTHHMHGQNLDRWPHDRVLKTGVFRSGCYHRLLAKIAHGYAVGALGINGFTPWLVDYILNGNGLALNPYYIGSGDTVNKLPPRHELRHDIVEGIFSRYPNLGPTPMNIVVVTVCLFTNFGLSEERVVVGALP